MLCKEIKKETKKKKLTKISWICIFENFAWLIFNYYIQVITYFINASIDSHAQMILSAQISGQQIRFH